MATTTNHRRRQRQQLGLFWMMVMQAVVIYNTIRRRNRHLPRGPRRNWDSGRGRIVAVNRRNSTVAFPIPRLTTPLDENDSGLGRLQANPFARNRHVRWSDEMDSFMITSLVEQVLAGHKRSDNGFTSFQVAKAMERVLNGCGVTVSDKNVRARLKTLKKEHAEVRTLLNTTGFGLDLETGRIVANAVAWGDFIKEKPKFGKWRNKLCPRYDKMETIFGNDASIREREVSGFDSAVRSVNERAVSDHFSPINVTDESVNEVDMENVEMDNSPVTAHKHTIEEGTNKVKRRRTRLMDESTIALLRIAESSTKIAQAMEIQVTLDTKNHVNWQLILEKLEAMALDMKDIMEVIKAFQSDDGLAKVFQNLTSEKYMRALVFDKLGRNPSPLP